MLDNGLGDGTPVVSSDFTAGARLATRHLLDLGHRRIAFVEGQDVKAGDVLVQIDPRPFQAALDQANSELRVANTLVDFTEAQFKRAEPLAAAGNMSASTLDDRRREFLAARSRVDGARAA